MKRGIPYLLVQIPMLAFLIGYAWDWTTFANATIFMLYLGVILLPAWIIYRQSRSDDPEEPVHHLGRYAVYALVPYAVYDLARVPTYYLLDAPYWDRWYDFGSQLTGIPAGWATLVTGTLVHMVQGYVLGLGFYILFRHHSLRNALLYLFVFLSLVYSWTFPTFILSSPTTPSFYFNVWWAHLWMALAAWFTPIAHQQLWPRLRSRGGRTAGVAGVSVIYLFPFGFAFWQASLLGPPI
ncbi:MAG: hypothetical protein ACRDHU_00930 [Actinomycetota bacterium]